MYDCHRPGITSLTPAETILRGVIAADRKRKRTLSRLESYRYSQITPDGCTARSPLGLPMKMWYKQSQARFLSRGVTDGSELAAAHASAVSISIENTNYYGAKDLASSFRTVRLPSVVSPRHPSSRIFLNESSAPFQRGSFPARIPNDIGAQWKRSIG